MADKRRLGRGLAALIPDYSGAEEPPKEVERFGEIPVNQIEPNPYQPREDFDPVALDELKQSIAEKGVVQPITVRRKNGGFQLVSGERRLRAVKELGYETIPAYIIRVESDDEMLELALIENIQREDLNPLEEARALERLRDEFGLTQQQVADAVGKSRVAVTNLLRLLKLTDRVREMLLAGELEMGHARALLPLGPLDQERLAAVVAAKGLSVRATEALVRARQQPERKKKPPAPDADTAALERELSDRLGAPVSIKTDARGGGGKLVIAYSSLDELDGILTHLK